MIGIRGYGFRTMFNQMDIEIKVDLELRLIKWLLDFGNVIMKVEILELEWFQTLNFVFIIVLISKLVDPN